MNEGKELTRRKLMGLFLDKKFVHIFFNSQLHFNGWILEVGENHIQFRDKKTDEVLLLRISDISLVEEKEVKDA